MNTPLVSVIMAVKNGERYLAEAIESVRAQTYTAHEIIVVDGHSTDATEKIAKSYQPLRFIYQAGRGLADAWNTGIKVAQGELMTFLDHDDYWAPHKLSLQVGYLVRHPEIQYTIAKVRFFLEPGHAIPRGFKTELFEEDQIGRIPGTLAARKSLFALIGGFDASLTIAADVDWFARAKDETIPMAIIPEVVLYKRIHQANLASDARVNNQELLGLLKRSIDRQRRKVSAQKWERES